MSNEYFSTVTPLLLDCSQAAATTVRHLMLPSHWQQRTQLVKDLITSYGCGGRTIVFTDTKADAGALALALQDS
jgi:ATP-dependent RNA helicase DDX21